MENNDKTAASCCSLDMGRGCRFCPGTEEEVTATACEGCYKLHSIDWLAEYPNNLPNDIVEVRFKNTRRSYYRNVNGLDLRRGDIVAVEAQPGHDIGIVSLTGDMVARQMRRTGFNPLNGEFRKVYRKAKPYDIEKWREAIALEHETMIRSRQIAADMGLNMKIGDVEYQGDKIKAIFYYIADERVDFRELIKVFAEQFHIRVEMKQIGARQEAGRIGGLGACGRELCCASWISGFVSVTTNAARTQEISLNPQKLAGQCSKLKCCLVYELDSYIEARKELPRVTHPLQTEEGDWAYVKSDILARTMSFGLVGGGPVVTVPAERVREVIDLNRNGTKPEGLVGENGREPEAEEPDFVNVIGEESITRFDNTRKRNRKGRRCGGRDEHQARSQEGAGESKTARREERGGEKTEGRRQPEERSRPSSEGTGESRKPAGQGTRGRQRNRSGGKNRAAAGRGKVDGRVSGVRPDESRGDKGVRPAKENRDGERSAEEIRLRQGQNDARGREKQGPREKQPGGGGRRRGGRRFGGRGGGGGNAGGPAGTPVTGGRD